MPRRGQSLTLLLLACALALRMLVPSGWMPAASGGPFAIEPCPSAEPAPHIAMPGHHHGTTDHHSHKAQHDGDCAFAPLTSAFAALDLAPGLAALVQPAALIVEAPAQRFFATGPPAPPPPATGPPALA